MVLLSEIQKKNKGSKAIEGDSLFPSKVGS